MQKRTKREVVAEFRCAEILDAARAVFSKRGFNDVTVDEIAAEAGLAKATVYQYFPSKQDIYLAALRVGVHQLLERTETAMSAAGGARAKIEAFVRTRLEYLHEHQEFFAVYHAQFGNLMHPAALNEEFRTLYRRQFEYLLAALEEGVKRGELAKVSVDVLAVTIYESTRGVMVHRCLGWSSATVDQQVASLMRILWEGAAKKESPSR
jgi:AcrR family transcriptional regulator